MLPFPPAKLLATDPRNNAYKKNFSFNCFFENAVIKRTIELNIQTIKILVCSHDTSRIDNGKLGLNFNSPKFCVKLL